jgi:CoA:oxalate CoA-transferase
VADDVSLELRVVEQDSSIAGAYCGRLLGMLGADVIKVEPPGGDLMRAAHPLVESHDGGEVSALFEYLNAFKRSVTLDSSTPEGADQLERLTRSANVVIRYVDGDVDQALEDYRSSAAADDRLIIVAISGFGLTGPYRHYRSNDFVDFASGGYMWITGEPDREPLQGGGPWAGYLVGTTAAAAALVATRQRRATGRGQLVDVAAMEVLASLHQWTIVLYTHQGVIKRRAGNMHAESYNPMGPVPCKDGWVSLGVASTPQWEGLCLAIDRPELLIDDRFQTGGDRVDRADELRELMEPALMSMTASELVERCQEMHVPAGPALKVPQVLDERQLIARNYWVESPRIGGRARMPERPFRVPGADVPFRQAPEAGEHTAEVLDALGSDLVDGSQA